MSKKLLFAIIAIICTTTAFADTKTLTTQDYVDAQDALKQDLIGTDMVTVDLKGDVVSLPTLISYDETDGLIGTKYGILNSQNSMTDLAILARNDPNLNNLLIPTQQMTRLYVQNETDLLQRKIPESGKVEYQKNAYHVMNYGSGDSGWLIDYVKGTGVVTKTTNSGFVGERQIIETADVANYGTGTATEQQIQEISIPTMGAVMAAISANAPTLPTGTAGNVVTYNASGQIGGSVATYNGSTTYNASTDASKIAVMSAVQRKMTCARYVENAAQTAENCLLWNVPD